MFALSRLVFSPTPGFGSQPCGCTEWPLVCSRCCIVFPCLRTHVASMRPLEARGWGLFLCHTVQQKWAGAPPDRSPLETSMPYTLRHCPKSRLLQFSAVQSGTFSSSLPLILPDAAEVNFPISFCCVEIGDSPSLLWEIARIPWKSPLARG